MASAALVCTAVITLIRPSRANALSQYGRMPLLQVCSSSGSAVIAALIEDRVPGLRAAHFHLCDDGKRIFNYAEWESGEAHLQAMQGGKGISQTDSAAWREVQSMTGITQQGFKHYALPLQISAMTAGMQQGGEYVW